MAISETRFLELVEQSRREHEAWLATHSADCLCNECTAGIGDTPEEPLFDFDD